MRKTLLYIALAGIVVVGTAFGAAKTSGLEGAVQAAAAQANDASFWTLGALETFTKQANSGDTVQNTTITPPGSVVSSIQITGNGTPAIVVTYGSSNISPLLNAAELTFTPQAEDAQAWSAGEPLAGWRCVVTGQATHATQYNIGDGTTAVMKLADFPLSMCTTSS